LKFFYGAGSGTSKLIVILKSILEAIFVAEDMLAVVYAFTGKDTAMFGVLGKGFNRCYFVGEDL
jgi:hypothetical protein